VTNGGAADSCHYLSQQVSGNQTIIARVVREAVVGSKFTTGVGVGMRASTAANAAAVSLTIQDVSNAVTLQLDARSATNGSTTEVGSPINLSVPVQIGGADPIQWLKLVRSGNSFTGYYSSDGAIWMSAGTVSVTMTDPLTTGLISCNRFNPATLCTATFDNVQVTTP
jgi:hypothetical protein